MLTLDNKYQGQPDTKQVRHHNETWKVFVTHETKAKRAALTLGKTYLNQLNVQCSKIMTVLTCRDNYNRERDE